MTSAPAPIDITAAFEGLDFLPDRMPETSETDADWAADLLTYRDGGVFIVHYAGESEWERHLAGDEIVMVIDGSTTITLIIDGEDLHLELSAMQMVIVPKGIWHRFDTRTGVKVMTVTPQPTDHRIDRPLN